MAKKTTSTKPKRAQQGAAASSAQQDDNHVPEWAEDMEHTLRRLSREKEQKRAENPGLYR